MDVRAALKLTLKPVKFELNKKLKDLLDKTNGDRSILALKELEKVTRKEDIDSGITTLANLIFIRSDNLKSSEKYKDFLKTWDLPIPFYEIPRLIHNGCYEQAALLAIDTFDMMSNNSNIDKERITFQLQLMTLLFEACERDDTQIIVLIMQRLSNLNLLTEQNMLDILFHGLNHDNAEVVTQCVKSIKTESLTDMTLLKIIELLTRSHKLDEAIQMITLLKSPECTNRACIQYIGSLDVNMGFETIDSLVNDGLLTIDSTLLPAEYLSISGLRDYETISELCENLIPKISDQVKDTLLFALLSSIDNRDIPLDSTIFLLNGLNKFKHIINESHKDIIIHQMSKYCLKLTSLKLFQYFDDLGIKLAQDDYTKLLKIHLNGSEIDTSFYVAVKFIEKYGILSDSMKTLYEEAKSVTMDNRIDILLNYNGDLAELKYNISYDYMSHNLQNERDRQKNDFKIPNGKLKYNYNEDIQMSNMLVFQNVR